MRPNSSGCFPVRLWFGGANPTHSGERRPPPTLWKKTPRLQTLVGVQTPVCAQFSRGANEAAESGWSRRQPRAVSLRLTLAQGEQQLMLAVLQKRSTASRGTRSRLTRLTRSRTPRFGTVGLKCLARGRDAVRVGLIAQYARFKLGRHPHALWQVHVPRRCDERAGALSTDAALLERRRRRGWEVGAAAGVSALCATYRADGRGQRIGDVHGEHERQWQWTDCRGIVVGIWWENKKLSLVGTTQLLTGSRFRIGAREISLFFPKCSQ